MPHCSGQLHTVGPHFWGERVRPGASWAVAGTSGPPAHPGSPGSSWQQFLPNHHQASQPSDGVLVKSGCPNKVPQPGWLQQQLVLSHSPGSWESVVKVWAGLGLPRPRSLACRRPSSCCILTWSSPLCASVSPSPLNTRMPVRSDAAHPKDFL